ncbi:adenosine deaminase 2-like isoform X5 [Teleopsis dalmanni]|uniref:adenosine deaminase 2-like isoform X5 n=1 Tax=Teleopsis dalmanni TaxID=139649 RepID=UPI0018CE3BAC|nr:adenosine deaminase 2-like isoform X5 [Teleopsis dalmanni]
MSVLSNLLNLSKNRIWHALRVAQKNLIQIPFSKNQIVKCNKHFSRSSTEVYNSLRDQFFCFEKSRALGANLELTERELEANEIIMAAKMQELEKGVITPHMFSPSQHFFSVLDQIHESPLFEFMSIMPKGGVLHAHDIALCSTDYLLELTYRENLWACMAGDGCEAVALKFSKQKPKDKVAKDCNWELLSSVRKKRGAEAMDEYLSDRFTLYPTEKYTDINEVWMAFMNIFGLLDGLMMYAPVWGDYYYNALKEFNEDGVQYLEFRTTLPQLYDMDGKKYTELDTVKIYKDTLDKFMKDHPDFIGSKLIYAPLRNVDDAAFDKYICTCIEIKEKYPDFVAGFDVVGQEELGRPLRDFVPQLLNVPNNIDFYFHAGETNWFGTSVDENVIDAVLLGTKRVGHGFALVKHPLVLQMLKERNIAIEINPISNQVLQLVADLRNHPCAFYFANNYPVVISCDDPSFWKASPLSHDFYMAFLGIASAHSDIRLLKKLAMNSLQYSALKGEEQITAMGKWQKKWDAFIEQIITCY